MTRRVVLVSYLAVLTTLVAAPAGAYIDGGSVSVLFQAVVAGLAVAGTAVAMLWHRVRSIFRRNTR